MLCKDFAHFKAPTKLIKHLVAVSPIDQMSAQAFGRWINAVSMALAPGIPARKQSGWTTILEHRAFFIGQGVLSARKRVWQQVRAAAARALEEGAEASPVHAEGRRKVVLRTDQAFNLVRSLVLLDEIDPEILRVAIPALPTPDRLTTQHRRMDLFLVRFFLFCRFLFRFFSRCTDIYRPTTKSPSLSLSPKPSRSLPRR